MIDQSVPKSTTRLQRGVCTECGEVAKALQAPRPNVGTGYEGPMYCRPCNPRFRALDFHYSSLERMAAS